MCEEYTEHAALNLNGSTRHGRGIETFEASKKRIERRLAELDEDEVACLCVESVVNEHRAEREKLMRELGVIEGAME